MDVLSTLWCSPLFFTCCFCLYLPRVQVAANGSRFSDTLARITRLQWPHCLTKNNTAADIHHVETMMDICSCCRPHLASISDAHLTSHCASFFGEPAFWLAIVPCYRPLSECVLGFPRCPPAPQDFCRRPWSSSSRLGRVKSLWTHLPPQDHLEKLLVFATIRLFDWGNQAHNVSTIVWFVPAEDGIWRKVRTTPALDFSFKNMTHCVCVVRFDLCLLSWSPSDTSNANTNIFLTHTICPWAAAEGCSKWH